jgi:hypothetical protein
VSGDLPGREKWFRFLAGEDVGPMVSPLCCEWHFREPYRWPFDHPEPFPEGHAHRMVTEQLASAGVCGWDPTFLFYAGFPLRNADAREAYKTVPIDGGTRTEGCIRTPYGDLTHIEEKKATAHVTKE